MGGIFGWKFFFLFPFVFLVFFLCFLGVFNGFLEVLRFFLRDFASRPLGL